MSEDKFKRFKKLLEYFIAHIEYIQNESIDNKGYSIYIAPLIHNMTFQTCGQGYSGAKIQNQISEWQDYGDSTICINVQGHYGKGYYTKKCYLNWKETGINIYAKWNDAITRITHLAFTDYMYWLVPPEYKDSEKFSIEDLGLFDDSEPNTEIAKMFNKFYLKIYNYKMNGMTKRYQDLLLANKNMILNGAPGTGKTYLSKLIASQMIKSSIKSDTTMKENQFINDHIGFVQFHPSLDYTDFVEGLRPYEEIGNIGFKRRDGIFKKFCKKAISHSNENFVFIIDEINRGDISKIFGELFFAIDSGYRGKNGIIETQYQNLINIDDSTKAEDVFKNGFYIPQNVYIIGTMNDIDRSVESMDFAMRRRFAFIEITAKESAENMLGKEESYAALVKGMKSETELIEACLNANTVIIIRMESLNNTIISEEIGLTLDYQIGAAYFLKYALYANSKDAFEKLWQNHLQCVLKEYLRGIGEESKKLQILKNSYDNA